MWLFYPIYRKKKMSIVLGYRPIGYSVFVYFLEGQVHKKES